MQINFITKKEYNGQNQLALHNKFISNEWATFLQWKQAGFNVKKGEKGTRIIKIVEVDASQTDLGKVTKVPRAYTVFNREQVSPIKQMVNSGAVGLAIAR